MPPLHFAINSTTLVEVQPGGGGGSGAVLPTVDVAVTPDAIFESTGNSFTFAFTRSGATDLPLLVNFSKGGTAVEGVDYSSIGTSVLIPAGQATGFVLVPVLINPEAESDETVVLTVIPGHGYEPGSTPSASGRITENPAGLPVPLVSVVANPTTLVEGSGSSFTFTFTRTGPTTAAQVVNFSNTGTAAEGTDYGTIASSITIPIGAATANLVVPVLANDAAESDETLIITVTAGSGYSPGSPAAATVTITQPRVTVSVFPDELLESSGESFDFTFTRTGPTTAALPVNFTNTGAAVEGTNYGTIGNSITIPIGSASAALEVPVLNAGMSPAELALTIGVAAGNNYLAGSPSSATALIAREGVGLPAPTVYLRMAADFADSSPNNWTVTPVNAPIINGSIVTPLGTGAGQFSAAGGTSTFLEIADDPALDPGDQSWAVSCFFHYLEDQGGFPGLVTKGAYQSSIGAWTYYIGQAQNGNPVGFGFSNPWRDTVASEVVTAGGGTAIGTWYRGTLNVDRGTNLATLFLGTTPVGTVSVAGVTFASTHPLRIAQGAIAAGGETGNQLSGYMRDVAYVVGSVFTTEQIAYLQTNPYLPA